MFRSLVALLTCLSFAILSKAQADYAQGCDDPEYHQYIEKQFGQIEAKNRRSYDSTLRDYELSLSTSNNLYQVIASLSRHLKYSAQFDPIDESMRKINRVFEHANTLSIDQQIAGDVFDGFSNETHSVGIARAWIAYRKGDKESAFEELLKSIELTDSALLSSFGPDFDFVRQLFGDGHIEPVLAYIDKTESFWKGKRADELRELWRRMIKAECKIQFDSVDLIKAQDLGLVIKRSN